MSSAAAAPLRFALVGNPNCGKTALFNLLTGSQQKVANYAGVTVERKEGRLVLPSGRRAQALDLPGAYSLVAVSPDEAITRDVCLGRAGEEQPLDVLVCVVDSTNLRLHLRFALELRRLRRPMVVALNMADAAASRGISIKLHRLAQALGIPVVETVAIQRDGARALVEALDRPVPVPSGVVEADEDLHEQVRAILDETVEWTAAAISREDRIDRWVLHPVFGLSIFALIMFLMFQAVFVGAVPFQDAIESSVAWVSGHVSELLPAGPLRDLLVQGVIAGAGGVLVFLPQILLLFLFILSLEESGYLPRAAVLLDRFMVAAGLSGRAFIPLLSSFACAVPGIMATRSIADPRSRLLTILIAPMMTCSARLPVYALLIGAFIPDRTVLGWASLRGLVLFFLYAFGILGALLAAYVVKRFAGTRAGAPLLLELPAYRMPNPRDLAWGLMQRGRIFLSRVGGIILGLSVLLWFISTYPTPPAEWGGTAIDYSYAGRMGRQLEAVFAPIGFSWQICVALIPGLAAREVAISGLATVYAVAGDEAVLAASLSSVIAAQWSLPTALALLAWYVFAPQCLSTLVVIGRETNSKRMALLAATYMTVLAYAAAWVTYRLAGSLL